MHREKTAFDTIFFSFYRGKSGWGNGSIYYYHHNYHYYSNNDHNILLLILWLLLIALIIVIIFEWWCKWGLGLFSVSRSALWPLSLPPSLSFSLSFFLSFSSCCNSPEHEPSVWSLPSLEGSCCGDCVEEGFVLFTLISCLIYYEL